MTMQVHKLAAAKRPRAAPRNRNGPVEVTRVHPGVLKTALRIARGDASKLVIVGPRHVEVLHN